MAVSTASLPEESGTYTERHVEGGGGAPLRRCLAPAAGHIDLEYDSGSLCIVSMEYESSESFMPCRHKVACDHCAAKIITKTNECPMCRSPLQAA